MGSSAGGSSNPICTIPAMRLGVGAPNEGHRPVEDEDAGRVVGDGRAQGLQQVPEDDLQVERPADPLRELRSRRTFSRGRRPTRPTAEQVRGSAPRRAGSRSTRRTRSSRRSRVLGLLPPPREVRHERPRAFHGEETGQGEPGLAHLDPEELAGLVEEGGGEERRSRSRCGAGRPRGPAPRPPAKTSWSKTAPRRPSRSEAKRETAAARRAAGPEDAGPRRARPGGRGARSGDRGGRAATPSGFASAKSRRRASPTRAEARRPSPSRLTPPAPGARAAGPGRRDGPRSRGPRARRSRRRPLRRRRGRGRAAPAGDVAPAPACAPVRGESTPRRAGPSRRRARRRRGSRPVAGGRSSPVHRPGVYFSVQRRNHSWQVRSSFGSRGPWGWRGRMQQLRRHAHRLQRVVELPALRDRHALVLVAVHDEARRLDPARAENGRVLDVDLRVVPGPGGEVRERELRACRRCR